MVRSRYARLPQDQQRAIERAALDEFAAHGFHDASLNRVLEASGMSKGSLYYHFDGKEDLYVHVARVELERLFDGLGPFPLPETGGPDAFWAAVEDHYLRIVTVLAGTPQLAALLRGWIAASGNPALQQAQEELAQLIEPWTGRALAAGRAAGAVRTDLPPGLLIAVVFGMGQAMDTWLLTHEPEDPERELPGLVRALVGMIRGALAPPGP